VELWRYPDATACMAAREGARKATSWKAAIARVAPMVQVRCAAVARCLNAVAAWSAEQCACSGRLHIAELLHAVPQPGLIFAVAVRAPARLPLSYVARVVACILLVVAVVS
jgi:hypothetical protein